MIVFLNEIKAPASGQELFSTFGQQRATARPLSFGVGTCIIPGERTGCRMKTTVQNMGDRIRALRLSRSMTQEQLARELGLTAQAVSKWENNTTMPDIQLLPELSSLLGVTIDGLFSMTDENRLDRIDRMLDNVRMLDHREREETERFLQEQRALPESRPRATLLLAALYNRLAEEYHEKAAPLAREALRLNPGEKAAHNAVFDAQRGAYQDWDYTNHHELIDFYKEVVSEHPEDIRSYFWLLDLLIADRRTAEARDVAERMKAVEYSYHYEMYLGDIARAEGDMTAAMDWWGKMLQSKVGQPWVILASYADRMAQHCRYDEAVEYYRRAMPLRPEPPFTDCEISIAHICEIRGDYTGAVAMWQQALDLIRKYYTTEGEYVDSVLREIERLRRKAAAVH